MADPGAHALIALKGSGAAAKVAAPELWVTMFKSFGMLLLVLAVLILVLWLMKRSFSHSGAAGGQQGLIRILASVYVAPKERIALLNVLDEKILVGITPQQISFLARIEDSKDMCGAGPAESDGGFFRALLKRKLHGSQPPQEEQGEEEP